MIKLKNLLPEAQETPEEKKETSNLYPEAGKNAPDSVKAAIEEFRNLSPEERAKTPLLYWLLGEGTPNYKMSKKDSRYVDVSQVKGQACGNCKSLYKRVTNGKYVCSQINEIGSPSEGKISISGWCNFWKSLENI